MYVTTSQAATACRPTPKPLSNGLRAEKKNLEYLEEAKRSIDHEKFEKRSEAEIIYESTSHSAQKNSSHQINRTSCLDEGKQLASIVVSKENMPVNKKEDPAVTYWSHELNHGHFPVTNNYHRCPIFSRSATFTNDIKDSRLKHGEDVFVPPKSK